MKQPSLNICQQVGRVAVEPIGTYRCESSLPKPAIHPLYSPTGVLLSGFEMSDHVWHRGLWFTIKFVNGENFWEETPPFGVQQSVSQPVCELINDRHVRLNHHLSWTSASTGPVIDERRTVDFYVGDDSVHTIDWTSRLRAQKNLTLDRTPYTTWGGYGGLAFRGSRELQDVSYLLPDGKSVASLVGQSHEWTVLQAVADGGVKRRVSIGFIDHPSNPRTPTPWYNKSGNGYTFANASFLFHEPLPVDSNTTLSLSYRVLMRDGSWTAPEFAQLAKTYRALKVS